MPSKSEAKTMEDPVCAGKIREIAMIIIHNNGEVKTEKIGNDTHQVTTSENMFVSDYQRLNKGKCNDMHTEHTWNNAGMKNALKETVRILRDQMLVDKDRTCVCMLLAFI